MHRLLRFNHLDANPPVVPVYNRTNAS